jgi:integrase/recombinase XerD
MEQASTCVRDELLIEMMYRLGCRVSEALAVTAEDIDLVRGLVTIIHLKSRLRLFCPECKARLSKLARYCAACGKMVDEATRREAEHRRLRTLPLDSHTLALLKNYIDQGGPVYKYGKKFIFGINRHRAWQIVRDCADRAGIPALINPETGRVRGVSPHRLRDAFAVHAMKMDDSGDGLRLLQEHLGHASFNTTAKYRKVAGEEHREWYEKLWSKET